MIKKHNLILAVLCLLVMPMACGNGLDLGNFDKDEWQADINGCNSNRNQMLKEIEEVKPKLLGLYQKAIIKVLGQPEEQELYKRSQTYYVYWLDPSQGCPSPIENPRKLEVRFTALGIANEINIR